MVLKGLQSMSEVVGLLSAQAHTSAGVLLTVLGLEPCLGHGRQLCAKPAPARPSIATTSVFRALLLLSWAALD